MAALSPADLDARESAAGAVPWHALDADAVLARLNVDPAVGLAPAEVEARGARHGRNELPVAQRRSLAAMLRNQLADFTIAVLAAAAVISGLLGEWTDTAAILAIVVLNAALGVAQEWRAERAMAALKSLASPQARVRRVGVVVATGLATELGRVAALLAGAERPASPLQQRLARFGRRLAYAVLAICAVIFAVGLARGEDPLAMFLTAVSLAVAAIPEALPAVVALALAVGAYRMSREAALIRRLPAVETLGSVTFVCSDKTGTLTANRMRVERVEAASAPTSAWRWDSPAPTSRARPRRSFCSTTTSRRSCARCARAAASTTTCASSSATR